MASPPTVHIFADVNLARPVQVDLLSALDWSRIHYPAWPEKYGVLLGLGDAHGRSFFGPTRRVGESSPRFYPLGAHADHSIGTGDSIAEQPPFEPVAS